MDGYDLRQDVWLATDVAWMIPIYVECLYYLTNYHHTSLRSTRSHILQIGL